MSKNHQNNSLNEEILIHRNPVLRWVFLIGGFVLVGIGILGMFLPLLPTTIFFILAAWCFARSSQRFHYWLHNNRFFGRYLSNYRAKGGMTRGSKIFSIAFLLAGISVSVFFLTDNLYIRILLVAIAAGVTWHLLAIKTIQEEKR
ncbi:MAG TPA: YbaN family protein [Ignavibacteria bacterium]|nr:YbaN family protein [Ignavibacteria bacterium]HMQ98797.1 YbaN family protein [Ignavibacteria bacterium]